MRLVVESGSIHCFIEEEEDIYKFVVSWYSDGGQFVSIIQQRFDAKHLNEGVCGWGGGWVKVEKKRRMLTT
jgi:hypothetical protein